MHKLLFTLLLVSIHMQASAQGWPTHAIKFVVPFGPGGANDLVARAVAQTVAKQLGQPIVIENHPGASSVIGADIVAKAAPDGYTFLVPAAGVITNALIRAQMPYKENDLVPIALMGISPSVIVVPADSPIKDLAGLMLAAQHGQGILFATAGTGSTPHFVAEMLKLKSGAKICWPLSTKRWTQPPKRAWWCHHMSRAANCAPSHPPGATELPRCPTSPQLQN